MKHNEVLEILAKQYEITNVGIIDGPRQFVADTFIGTQNTNKYFVKVISKSKLPTKIIKSLPVLPYLKEQGIKQIPDIIFTKTGELFVENLEYIFVVFSFIVGQQTFEYSNEELGMFLAKLHKVKPNDNIETESFSSYVDTVFPKYFEESLKPTKDSVVQEMQQIFLEHEAELRKDWDSFKKIIIECKKYSAKDFVLTHGDAPGNIMINNNEELFVIDWDDIMVAPAERDIWFLVSNKEFMNGYTKDNPNFKINELFYKYYLYWRMFDDLYGWMNEILENNAPEHKQKNLEHLKKDYLNWVRPLVRNL